MCSFKPQSVAATCSTYGELLPRGEELLLQRAVVAVGPIAAAVVGTLKSFLLYQSGVYDEPSCSNYSVNHAVLVVGYGSDCGGREYWLVKNSWGVHWGDNGYIRMSRNKKNQCGIATMASFPVV